MKLWEIILCFFFSVWIGFLMVVAHNKHIEKQVDKRVSEILNKKDNRQGN